VPGPGYGCAELRHVFQQRIHFRRGSHIVRQRKAAESRALR
jgi:hypothetical protein